MSSLNDVRPDGSSNVGHLSGKYLTFALGNERYAFPILRVQEIIGMMHITQVPGTASFLKGVINLRGKVIPVIDLRLKFDMPPMAYNEKTCIVVVEVELEADSGHVQMGVIVDTVLEVINLSTNNIERAPDYGVNLKIPFVLGIGRTEGESVVILVDVDKALAGAGQGAAISG